MAHQKNVTNDSKNMYHLTAKLSIHILRNREDMALKKTSLLILKTYVHLTRKLVTYS